MDKKTKTPGEQLYETDREFAKGVNIISAYNAYQSGQPVKEIAAQAGKSESTVRRWIREGERWT